MSSSPLSPDFSRRITTEHWLFCKNSPLFVGLFWKRALFLIGPLLHKDTHWLFQWPRHFFVGLFSKESCLCGSLFKRVLFLWGSLLHKRPQWLCQQELRLSTRITTGDAHKLDLKIVYALLEEEEGGRSWGDFLRFFGVQTQCLIDKWLNIGSFARIAHFSWVSFEKEHYFWGEDSVSHRQAHIETCAHAHVQTCMHTNTVANTHTHKRMRTHTKAYTHAHHLSLSLPLSLFFLSSPNSTSQSRSLSFTSSCTHTNTHTYTHIQTHVLSGWYCFILYEQK